MQFLNEQLGNNELTDDAKESIEVAIQCLETAFNINPVDGSLPSKKPLLDIFASYLENNKEAESAKAVVISDEDKAKADVLKNEGNELMKNGKFTEALETYSKAIQIDGTNPIYYCNRAAAHSKLENYQATLEDCKIAIKHDPNYSKAYCRMGLAYVNLGDHMRARDCYKKAVELDPSESNAKNLELAEQKIQEEQAQFSSGFNLGNILNNPNLMNFASQMMTDPNMRNMLSGLMSNAMAGQGGEQGEGGAGGPGAGGGLDAFLQAGQQFAQQMQEANPELVEQLKSAFKKPGDGGQDENPDKGGQS